MKEELDGLYTQVAELRARLAQYDLPAAMEAAARDAMVGGVGATMTHSDGSVSHVKMPWSS